MSYHSLQTIYHHVYGLVQLQRRACRIILCKQSTTLNDILNYIEQRISINVQGITKCSLGMFNYNFSPTSKSYRPYVLQIKQIFLEIARVSSTYKTHGSMPKVKVTLRGQMSKNCILNPVWAIASCCCIVLVRNVHPHE